MRCPVGGVKPRSVRAQGDAPRAIADAIDRAHLFARGEVDDGDRSASATRHVELLAIDREHGPHRPRAGRRRRVLANRDAAEHFESRSVQHRDGPAEFVGDERRETVVRQDDRPRARSCGHVCEDRERRRVDRSDLVVLLGGHEDDLAIRTNCHAFGFAPDLHPGQNGAGGDVEDGHLGRFFVRNVKRSPVRRQIERLGVLSNLVGADELS